MQQHVGFLDGADLFFCRLAVLPLPASRGRPGPDDVFSPLGWVRPLGEEEPSLALPPMMQSSIEIEPEAEDAQAYEQDPMAAAAVAGLVGPVDDIEFPSSRNSPDMPGASSVYLSQWEAREESQPQSPRSEHSGHSSIYQGASARTSMNGGGRGGGTTSGQALRDRQLWGLSAF